MTASSFASAVDGPEFALTPADMFNALAETVLKDGALVANPHTNWSDFNPALPAQEILVLSPGTKHGTREVYDSKSSSRAARKPAPWPRIWPLAWTRTLPKTPA